jgi:molybdopterin/thiamine biosynthesis adenylyltransferase
MSIRFWRQTDLANPEKLQENITVIGTGSVGSFVVLTLAKLGCKNITVFDFDDVEIHNLPNQFYRNCDIGKPKVEALKSIVKDFEGFDISAKNEKFQDQEFIPGYVIFAVDNMDERMKIWERIRLNPQVKKLFDARMGGEMMRLFTINPCDLDDIKFYEKVLYPTKEAQELPCTARAIIYNVLAIACLVSNNVKRAMLGQRLKREIAFDLNTLNFYSNK